MTYLNHMVMWASILYLITIWSSSPTYAFSVSEVKAAFVNLNKLNFKISLNEIASPLKSVAGAAAIFCLTAAGPAAPQTALAVSPPVEAALIEASDATYPILKTLTPETISPVSNSIVKLLGKKVAPDKFANLLSKGIDVILSISDEELATFTTSVKDAYGEMSAYSCDLVPLPTAAVDNFLNLEGLKMVDETKFKALDEKVGATLKAIPKQADGAAVCLPEEKNLEKLFIAQTDLSLKVNPNSLKEFGAAGSSVGKTIPLGELLKLLPEFQKTERGVDMKAKKRFENAGKGVDTAIKRDASFMRLTGKI